MKVYVALGLAFGIALLVMLLALLLKFRRRVAACVTRQGSYKRSALDSFSDTEDGGEDSSRPLQRGVQAQVAREAGGDVKFQFLRSDLKREWNGTETVL